MQVYPRSQGTQSDSQQEKKMSPVIGRLAHEASVSLGPSPEQLTLQKGLTQSSQREAVSQE